jgi:MarR family transcriptional regulator, 2-MHQ and catechol-resistance regulon repressor
MTENTKNNRKAQGALDAYAELMQATDRVNALLDRQFESFDLTTSQFRVLEAVKDNGPLSYTGIAEKLVCTGGNITHLAANLEQRGLALLKADTRDTRKKMVHLTPEGEKLMARIFPVRTKLVRAQMSALGNREQETLRRLCRKLGEGDVLKFVSEMTRWDVEEMEAGFSGEA